jgi:hypothetical protein
MEGRKFESSVVRGAEVRGSRVSLNKHRPVTFLLSKSAV